MKIRDLPEHIRKIAQERYEEHCKRNAFSVSSNPSVMSFTWNQTPEGDIPWSRVYDGNFSDFPEPTKTVPTCPTKLSVNEVIYCNTLEENAPVKQFKRGDKLKVVRLPTKEDWSGGTSVSAHDAIQLSDKCTFIKVHHGREQFIHVDVEGCPSKSDCYYPACCFELVQEAETFKVGDLVEFYREPTREDWKTIYNSMVTPGSDLYKKGRVQYNDSTGLMFSESDYRWPPSCFRKVETEQVKPVEDLPGWRRHTSLEDVLEYVTKRVDENHYSFSHQVQKGRLTGSRQDLSYSPSDKFISPTKYDIILLKELNLWPSPDNPEKQEDSFPSEWCIQVSADNRDHPLLAKWRGSWISSGYIKSDRIWGSCRPNTSEITYEQFCNHYFPGVPMYPVSTSEPSFDRESLERQLRVAKDLGYMPIDTTPKQGFIPRWMRDGNRLEFVVSVDSEDDYQYTCAVRGKDITRFWGSVPHYGGKYKNLIPVTPGDIRHLQELGLPQWKDNKAPTSRSQLQECYPNLHKDAETSQYLSSFLMTDKESFSEKHVYNHVIDHRDHRLFYPLTPDDCEQGLPKLYKPKKVIIFDPNIPEVKPINIKLLKRKTP